MIYVDGVPVIGTTCIVSDGAAPSTPPTVIPPVTPIDGSDKFVWAVAWINDEGDVRVEWLFDGDADEFKVYKNEVLVSTQVEIYHIDPLWDDADEYVIEAYIDGQLVDTIGPCIIDKDLIDCNMLVIGSVVSLGCHELADIPCYLYDDSKTALFSNRSLISKIELFTKTDSNGLYFFYVKRGLRVVIHIPTADFMQKIALPMDAPALLVQLKG